ncbi:MAG: FxsA family protein [Serratia symbiotica]|nr:FxsA family protein [Serratia symbiotica]
MRWLPTLLIFLLAYIEITLFIKISDVLGVAFTLLLVIFTSCIGISLIRNQGTRTFVQIQQNLSTSESTEVEIVRNVSLMIAGFLLMIPGFFTDFLGLLLLLPPVQKLLTLRLMPHLSVYRFVGLESGGNAATGNTFDGEFQCKDNERYMLEQRTDNQDKHNDC